MPRSNSTECVREEAGFALGRQMTVEFYDCTPAVLTDAALMEKIFLDAAHQSGATVIDSRFHQFVPQGVSGVVVISESHFAVHAWPEHEYAAVDLFTCGENVDFDKAIEVIAQGIGSKQQIVSSLVNRGIVGNNGIERMVPVVEQPNCRTFQLSWKSRCEQTNAAAISSAMDICECRALDFDSPDALRDFVAMFLKHNGLTPCGTMTVAPVEKGGFNFVQLLKNGSLSGSTAAMRRTVYLDLFVKGFIDPRKAAESAVELLKGSYYRMQPQVRI